jgi:hypothetical protein
MGEAKAKHGARRWGNVCAVIGIVGLPVNFVLLAHYSAAYPRLSDSEGLDLSGLPMPHRAIMVSAFLVMFVANCGWAFLGPRINFWPSGRRSGR